jgi:large subunit ribosomal protein L10
MAVSRAEKVEELSGIERALGAVETAILIDYRGLTVTTATELRRQIRAAGGQYRVVKNTLARRAIKGTPFEVLEPHFKGTTAIASSGGDPVALAKTLSTFVKSVETMQIKAAVVQGRPVSAAGVTELATLPGKPQLYAQLLSVLQAPMVQIVSVLSAVPRDLVNVLTAYERKQGDA